MSNFSFLDAFDIRKIHTPEYNVSRILTNLEAQHASLLSQP